MNNTELVRAAYNKYINGDNLTDEEIAAGVEHYRVLAKMLFSSPAEFHIAAKEANRCYIALASFQDARRSRG